MKKIFLLLALLSLSACTTINNKTLNENTADKIDNNKTSNLNIDQIKNEETKQEIEQNIQQEKTTTKDNNIITNKKKENMNKAIIKTSKGTITVKLDAEKAPISVENFKKYATSGYYNGTIFHRVMPGFMIQGGGFDESGQQKPTEGEIKNEAKNGLKNNRGTLAMARTQVVDSATSQFFINLIDNDFLNYKDDVNYGYAVFGEVLDGMDVVDAISQVETGQHGPHGDWPKENIVILSVEIVQ